MTHAEMDELYELYVMRVLEPELAAEIDRHVAEGCEHCTAGIQEALALTAALATIASSEKPSGALKERVLRSLIPDRKLSIMPTPVANVQRRNGGLLGLSAACAALLLGCIWLGYENGNIRTRLDAVSQERAQLEAVLKTLSRSEIKTVQFGKEDQPHGRVFVSRANGVVFIASSLPKLASDRTFQLWLIPPTGAPQSAGLFQPDANNESVRVSSTPVEPGTKAVAVSVEPQAGSPAPTTTPIIIVPLGE